MRFFTLSVVITALLTTYGWHEARGEAGGLVKSDYSIHYSSKHKVILIRTYHWNTNGPGYSKHHGKISIADAKAKALGELDIRYTEPSEGRPPQNIQFEVESSLPKQFKELLGDLLRKTRSQTYPSATIEKEISTFLAAALAALESKPLKLVSGEKCPYKLVTTKRPGKADNYGEFPIYTVRLNRDGDTVADPLFVREIKNSFHRGFTGSAELLGCQVDLPTPIALLLLRYYTYTYGDNQVVHLQPIEKK